MACGNTYGLLWIIVLMGHGLASVPLRLWQHPSRTARLDRMYATVSSTHADSVEAVQVLERVEHCIATALEQVLDDGDPKLARHLDCCDADQQLSQHPTRLVQHPQQYLSKGIRTRTFCLQQHLLHSPRGQRWQKHKQPMHSFQHRVLHV